jgi:hypothetical protein
MQAAGNAVGYRMLHDFMAKRLAELRQQRAGGERESGGKGGAGGKRAGVAKAVV